MNLKHQTETFIASAKVSEKLLIRQLNKDQNTYFSRKFLQNIQQGILGGRIFSSAIYDIQLKGRYTFNAFLKEKRVNSHRNIQKRV